MLSCIKITYHLVSSLNAFRELCLLQGRPWLKLIPGHTRRWLDPWKTQRKTQIKYKVKTLFFVFFSKHWKCCESCDTASFPYLMNFSMYFSQKSAASGPPWPSKTAKYRMLSVICETWKRSSFSLRWPMREAQPTFDRLTFGMGLP